jgi:isocitrate dehydrogenase kinase/phosphatase
MIKSIGALLGGIFIGAVAMEIVRRKYPNAFDKVYGGAREVASGAKEAFEQGYANATRPPAAMEPGI